MRWENSLRGSC